MAKGATPSQWAGSSHIALSCLTASMPPVNKSWGGLGMSLVSTEMDFLAMKLSLGLRSAGEVHDSLGLGALNSGDC